MDACLFCKIVAGDIPSAKVHQTKNSLAFLDINPVNPGHTLIVPKKHYQDIFEMPDEILAEVAKETKLIGQALKNATGATGITVLTRNHQTAGQEIPHSHTHVIPRYLGDGYKSWSGKKYQDGEMEKVAEKIKRGIR